jgi:hypothetical protein
MVYATAGSEARSPKKTATLAKVTTVSQSLKSKAVIIELADHMT